MHRNNLRYLPIAILVWSALVAIGGIYSEWRVLESFVGQSDFPGYYTAALLVASGQSDRIYNGHGQHVDPTQFGSDPRSYFAQTALARGIRNVPLYDYPPTLADLLVPLTALLPVPALIVWEILNGLALLFSCVLLARMLGNDSATAIAAVTLFVATFRPTVATFLYGQVGVLLLFLLLAGFHLYRRGRIVSACGLFALAAAIKLTPLCVIFPLLAWRDWKALRSLALWCLALTALLCAVNGPGALDLYLTSRLPAMSHQVIDLTNLDLRTAIQAFVNGTDQVAVSMDSVWVGRLLSLLLLCLAAWLGRTPRGASPPDDRKLVVFSSFLLLSCCVSPIAWRHSYVLAAPALVLIARRIVQHRATALEVALPLPFVLSLSTDKFAKWAWTYHYPVLYWIAMLPPVLGLLIGLFEIARSAKTPQPQVPQSL